MRELDRNKTYIYYATQTGKTEITDADGYATGQFTITYGNVIATKHNVSAARGSVEVDEFGMNANYSKTSVTSNLTETINESSIAWVGYGKVEAFSSTKAYSIGDLVVYGSSLYSCKVAGTGAWVDNNWLKIPHNYIVVGVAKSLNSVKYALREVQIDG